MTAYYNEIDEYAAKWLRNLIAAGHIAPGDVDTRSIEDVHPDDLRKYTQCHFFAGIGGWSLALRLAGWPDDRSVWSGSCPCQPFSAAGKGNGFTDERHLWPAFYHLIGERRPTAIYGEQVASRDAEVWLDLVQTDVEALGYAFGAVAFPAAGIGAPHIRDRTYWVADSESKRSGARRTNNAAELLVPDGAGQSSIPRRLGIDDDPRLEGLGSRHQTESGRNGTIRPVTETSKLSGLGDAKHHGQYGLAQQGGHDATGIDYSKGATSSIQFKGAGFTGDDRGSSGSERDNLAALRAGPTNGLWRAADWLLCRDGKWRPVEPSTFPLAHGVPGRVGRLRAYGNAIVPQQAAAFIRAGQP